MDKILVEVVVPATNNIFDVYIPIYMKFYDVTFLVSNLVSDLSDGLFTWSENSVLCNADTGKIFNVNLSAEELDLKNGSKLMLI